MVISGAARRVRSSTDPRHFSSLADRATSRAVQAALPFYVPKPKEELFDIWARQKAMTAGELTADQTLPEDERVEDAGLDYDEDAAVVTILEGGRAEADEQVLNNDLARLREFHLYASGGDPRTGAKLEVPEPILLMRDILESRVLNPRRLAQECARLRSNQPRVDDRVSFAIRTVVALWKEEDCEAAELFARNAVKENKKSGDLHCVLGQCQMKLKPPRLEEADKAFAEALRLKSNRVELLPNWLEAKAGLNDWMGIVEVVGKAAREDVRSHVAYYQARALAELGRQAVQQRNDTVKAIERFKQAMTEASRSIGQGRAGECLADLRDLCRACAHNYVGMVDMESIRDRDRLDVFNAVSDAFECHVTESRLVSLGVRALVTWSNDAIDRSGADAEPFRILERRLDRLEEMKIHIEAQGPQRRDLAECMADTGWRLRDKIREAKRG